MDLVAFSAPVFLVVMVGMLTVGLGNIAVNMLSRLQEIGAALPEMLTQYEFLRDSLPELGEREGNPLKYFLPEASTNIWLVALGTLLNRCLEGFFYPFFVILAIGLWSGWEKIKTDGRTRYLSFIVISALVLLYLQTIRTWILHYRFLAILIFPCFVFFGYGLESIFSFMKSRFRMKESLVAVMLCLFSYTAPPAAAPPIEVH